MFDIEKYNQSLQTQWLGRSMSYHDELESTNTYLKKLPESEVVNGHLCLADHQTRGRGQYERNWEAAAGKNLTFTLAFKPPIARRFHVLTLACARAAVAEIEAYTGCEAFIKWPNDILIEGKKVAGLLTEAVFNGNVLDRLLIGIGMNINQDSFSDELRSKAISLKQVIHKPIGREEFLCRYLSRIEFEYMRWHKQNDDLIKFINQKIMGYGQWVTFKVDGRETANKYKLLGINQKGQLTAITKEGDLKSFSHEQIQLITD